MWKQTVGDWHERRSHRGGPAPVTPQSNLPESVASTEHSARGFLPPTFKDKTARAAYPVADGAHTRLDGATLEKRAAARANTEAWVSITGASPDDVLDVRDFLDATVGRTVSHYMPPPTRVRPDTVYVQFASALQAAQAVRSVTFTTCVESGVAAIGVRRDVDRASAAEPSTPHFYLEIVVSWCTDQIFLAERESLRRQLRESAAPTPLRSQPDLTRASVASDTASAAATRSLASSGRGSEPLATSGAAAVTHDDDDDGAAAHPLLPRHRGGASQPTPSPWSSRDSTASPSPSQQQQPQARGELPVRDAASSLQAGAPYRAKDAHLSDGLHSDHHDGRQRSTMLSLFIHPCSAPYGVAYSFCLYRPLRLLVFLLWTLWNAARQLLSPPNAAAASTSQWRQRRTLRMADVVPASASPWDYLSFFFYSYVPFTPEPADVDVVLWSWLALHSPYPQRSLSVLKQSLLVRQRSTDQMVGRLRRGGGVGDEDDGIGGSEVHQLASFGRVDVLGGEPSPDFVRSQYQQQSERQRELPVLLRWRPAWWFARQSALSLAVIAALVCYRLWCTME